MKILSIKELNEKYPELEDVISNISIYEDGTYYLKNGIYFNVDSYSTKNRQTKLFESHKKYIDIQIILSGHEIISIKDINNLNICKPYILNNDVAFYLNEPADEEILLENGKALVLFPNDGHMPGISPNDGISEKIRKLVFKIPYKPKNDIKYLLMDVDGTLTDGKVYISENGELFKGFNIKDGYVLNGLFEKTGIKPIIITGRKSDIVINRCKELNIHDIYQGVKNKLDTLKTITKDFSNIAYIGDDLNDIDCMKEIKKNGGLIGCPINSADEVISISDYVSQFKGGEGAVRDFIKWLQNRGENFSG